MNLIFSCSSARNGNFGEQIGEEIDCNSVLNDNFDDGEEIEYLNNPDDEDDSTSCIGLDFDLTQEDTPPCKRQRVRTEENSSQKGTTTCKQKKVPNKNSPVANYSKNNSSAVDTMILDCLSKKPDPNISFFEDLAREMCVLPRKTQLKLKIKFQQLVLAELPD